MPASRDDFLWHVHGYTNEYIRFADAKATVVLGWASALIGAMVTAHVNRLTFTEHREMGWFLPSLCAFAFLAAAFLCAVMAIRPRVSFERWSMQRRGFIFWNSIQAFPNRNEFWQAFEKTEPSDLTKHIADHLFDLARVAQTKFLWANISICLAVLGTGVAAWIMFFDAHGLIAAK